jgi:hypothetical protein
MSNNLPAAAFGHFILKVSDISTSYKFYSDMGLRPSSNCAAGPTFYCLARMANRHSHYTPAASDSAARSLVSDSI